MVSETQSLFATGGKPLFGSENGHDAVTPLHLSNDSDGGLGLLAAPAAAPATRTTTRLSLMTDKAWAAAFTT